MTTTSQESFWDRLAVRTRPGGAAANVENPRTIMRIATGAAWAASANALSTAVVFFWFDEPAAGWITVAVTFAYLSAWVGYAATGSSVSLTGITVAASIIDIVAIHWLLGGYAHSGNYLAWGSPKC